MNPILGETYEMFFEDGSRVIKINKKIKKNIK